MTLLNTIILPFQAGYENIITASGKSRELPVIKRIFKDNHYQYTPQSDKSLFSWQGRVSMFAKGVALCLPFIGHITSIALRYFSSSIFPEMPLDFAIKCSPEQKLAIAKRLYIDRPEGVNEATRTVLAKILANDATGLDLLVVNIPYLDLMTDTEFSLKLIRENPEALNQINDNITFAQQLFRLEKIASPEDKSTIAQKFADLLLNNIHYLEFMENEELALAIIRKNPEVLKLINHNEFREILESSKLEESSFLIRNLAKTSADEFSKKILNLLKNAPPEDKLTIAKQFYLHQPEIHSSWRLALARILAADATGLNLLLDKISYLDLREDPKFSISIVQGKPELLDKIERYNPSFFKDLTEYFDNFLPLIKNKEFALAIIQKKPELLNEIDLYDHEVANRILDLLEHFTPEQKLAVAKQFYRCQPEIDQPNRLKLAKILVGDKEGLNLLTAEHLFDLLQEASLEQKLAIAKLILNEPKSDDKIRMELIRILVNEVANIPDEKKSSFIEILQQNKSLFAKQILQQDPTDCKFITIWLDHLHLNEDLTKTFVKELILQTKEVDLSDRMKAAIIYSLKTRTNKNLIKDLLEDTDCNIALAEILLSSEENRHFVIDNIKYLELFKNMDFTQKLFQVNPIPEQIKQCFAEQILQQDSDREFIIKLFDSFNEKTQKEVIEELLSEIGSSSEQMQIAIAQTIIEKQKFLGLLLEKIDQFKHTQELADLLVKTPNGKTYIASNIKKFNLSEEQKKSLLEKCTMSNLV